MSAPASAPTPPATGDSRPVILRSPYRELLLAMDMGETRYEEGGRKKVHRMPHNIPFRRGVATVTRAQWEAMGFASRDALVSALNARHDRNDFTIVDLNELSGGRAPARPPADRP